MYVATINVPGYLPMDDDPPVFDMAINAWEWLAEQRESEEDQFEDWEGDNGLGEYSSTVATLRYLGSQDHQPGNPHEDWPTAANGTGTVYGSTPGYDGDHDLGLAYSVTWCEEN